MKNSETISLKDFDMLGMIELEDVDGIEDLVTPIGNGKYVSRSPMFWKQYTCTEASEFRESLKRALPLCSGKKAFVLLDYMSNLSGKVYYAQLIKYISRPDKANTEQAKECLKEDVSNIVRLLEGDKPIISNTGTKKLPRGDDLVAERNIECNNHALLYIYSKYFRVPENSAILNTGLGGIFIGPYFNKFHSTQWTNVIKSKYVSETNPSHIRNFMELIIKPEILNNKTVLLLDDNIGTGDTITELKLKLNENGFNVKTGAVQYNWVNFYRVGIGEKKGITRFDPTAIDYVTYFNYPGHKLIEHANEILCGQRNLDGRYTKFNPYDGRPFGEIYKDYKLKKHYFEEFPGVLSLREKGLRYSKMSGFPICDFENNITEFNPNLKSTSKYLMGKLDDSIVESIIGGPILPQQKNEE